LVLAIDDVLRKIKIIGIGLIENVFLSKTHKNGVV